MNAALFVRDEAAVASAAAAVDAAIVACRAHWSECCRSGAAHWLDDGNLCDTGKALYGEFEAAERAHRIASYGDPRPLAYAFPYADAVAVGSAS